MRNPGTILQQNSHLNLTTDPAEDLGRHLGARNDALFPRIDESARTSVGRNKVGRGDITRPDIFGERDVDEETAVSITSTIAKVDRATKPENSLAHHRHHNLSRMPGPSVLEEENPLPSA
jgi:hypothetical protein